MKKNFCIFGNPISHSLSPLMHNFAFEKLSHKLGFMGDYRAICLEDAKSLRQKFLQGGFQGANITVPFKEEAFLQCDEVCGMAKDIGAVNTWVLNSGKIFGYNTDAMGFYKSIENLGFKSAVILGAGGSAKPIAHILKQKNFTVTILNRSAQRLSDFDGFECGVYTDFSKTHNFDLVINATSASLQQTLPCDNRILTEILDGAKMAYDLLYAKNTPFLDLALRMNRPIKDGLEMLIYQGALAFLLFCDAAWEQEDTKCDLSFFEVAEWMKQGLSIRV